MELLIPDRGNIYIHTYIHLSVFDMSKKTNRVGYLKIRLVHLYLGLGYQGFEAIKAERCNLETLISVTLIKVHCLLGMRAMV